MCEKSFLCFLFVFVLLTSCFFSCSGASHSYSSKKDLSPHDFGLTNAQSGTERYWVLFETHNAAIKAGVNVDYSGIDTIYIDIPDRPKQIPLTRLNDFKGCVFVVKNSSKNHRLFSYSEKKIPISVSKQCIDAGDFRTIEQLKNGRCLLLIQDENPWVLNRRGYNYGHQRKDVLLIENGLAKNKVTMPYSNGYSDPKCDFIPLTDSPFIFKNITIERDSGSKYVSNVAYIAGANDVQISNVKLHTPKNSLNNDRGILIYNCTNVNLDNVFIDGTYSQLNHSGYGITLNNIWNLRVTRMYGKANWGVFGNNNINVASVEDSQINRFDIHCYGRDVSFKNVEFFDLYNQYSSVYGTIRYDKCTFTNFVPMLNGGSYNAFVPHDIVLNDCVFNAMPKKNFLIKISGIKGDVNERYELAQKSLPNVRIKNLTVRLINGADYFYLFNTNSESKKIENFNYISKIKIDGLTIVPDGGGAFRGMALSNVKLNTFSAVDCTLQNVEVRMVDGNIKSAGSSGISAVLKANMSLKGGKAVLTNVTGLKQ